MKSSQYIFLNLIHGWFLGLVIGMTLSILALEFLPEIESFMHPAYIYLVLSIIGAVIGYLKGYNNYTRLLSFLFSTLGTILTPIIATILLYYFIGFNRLLSLPPIIFKSGIGLRGMDTMLSVYIFTSILTLGFVGAIISSFSINKRNRWTL
ncbi:MAG: hypothetical protein JJT76_13705 [Clostridiaceae bacterium]|nr:hypothetical protein [Clostridiaceae bacterium]